MGYKSLKELCRIAADTDTSFWEVVQADDCKERQVTQKDSFETMRGMYLAMKKADETYAGKHKSPSGMVGGDGQKLMDYVLKGKNMSGEFIGKVMARAVKMAESNACMGRIVAAPTAGSCGVIPAVLLTYEEMKKCPQDRIVEALYVSAGIGQIIAERASIAGASGGCQAEIGASSAMAAGALAYLEGGDEEAICSAAAIALKGLLGLTCDPIAGLVEVPCVKRNVIGSVNAVTSADLVIAGITSVVPPDEVIDAMGEIGREMPKRYKETSEGGLAITPTAMNIARKLKEV